jgi:hypothetical protein
MRPGRARRGLAAAGRLTPVAAASGAATRPRRTTTRSRQVRARCIAAVGGSVPASASAAVVAEKAEEGPAAVFSTAAAERLSCRIRRRATLTPTCTARSRTLARRACRTQLAPATGAPSRARARARTTSRPTRRRPSRPSCRRPGRPCSARSARRLVARAPVRPCSPVQVEAGLTLTAACQARPGRVPSSRTASTTQRSTRP